MSNEQQQHPSLNIFIIIWAAILWSCCLFLGLIFFKTGAPLLSFNELSSEQFTQFLIFLAISVMNLMAGFIIPKVMIKSTRLEASMTYEDSEKKYFVPFIIKIILFESCSLLGLVISMNAQKNLILPFFIMSLAGILMSFPTRNKVKNAFMRRR